MSENNNYIKAFFKSFNAIHLIIIALFVMGIYFLGANAEALMPNLSNYEGFKYTVRGLYILILGGIGLCLLTRIKAKEINLFDLFSMSNLLGVLVGLIYDMVTGKASSYSIILAIIAFAYLVGLILRFFLAKPQAINNQFKLYMHNLAAKANMLVFTAIGAIVAIYVTNYFKFDSSLYININNYFYAILIGIALLGAIAVLASTSKVTLIDYLLILALCLFTCMVIYSSKADSNLYPLDNALALAITTAFVLYFRGLSFKGDYNYSARIKDNNYHAAVLAKYDYALITIYGVLAISLIAMPNLSLGAINYIVRKFTATGFDASKYKIVINVVAGVLLAIPFVLIIAKHNLKDKKVNISDYALKMLEILSVLGLPLVFKLITAAKQINLTAMIMAGIIVAVILATILIYIVRIKCYEVVSWDSLSVNEETSNVEEPIADNSTEEASNEDSNVAEEPVEEKADDEAEEKTEVSEADGASETLDEALAETKEEADAIEAVESRSLEPEQEEAEEESSDEDDDVEELDEDDKEENTPASLVVSEQRIRLSFEEKTTLVSDETKKYYNEVKNYLLMYRAHARLSKKCESFRYKGLLAKVGFAGKSLKVNLAIDPKTLEGTKYFFKDRSDKKQYQLVPTQIKIKSERGLKYFKELVDMMMQARDVKPKRRYEPVDYTSSLIPNGHAVLYTLGVTKDHLVDMMDVSNVPNDLPIDLVYHIPTIAGEAIEGMKEENSIYLDTLCKHFNDGDTISLDILKHNNILTRGNMLRIKARGTLDKHFTIYADSFEANALAMLLCTGSKAVKLIRTKKQKN